MVKKHLNVFTSVSHTMTQILFFFFWWHWPIYWHNNTIRFETWIKCFGWVTTFWRDDKFWCSDSKQLWQLN